MNSVKVIGNNIVSPLGLTSEENFNTILHLQSSLMQIAIPNTEEYTFVSTLNEEQKNLLNEFCGHTFSTQFEKLLYYSIAQANLGRRVDLASKRTIFLFSTTKGNIEIIDKQGVLASDLNLYISAQKIAQAFRNENRPIVISNACISGTVALIMASRLLQSGTYDTAIVAGADTVNNFVLSGFQSLKALSDAACKPFDKNRKGINLGEAGSTVILQAGKPLPEAGKGIYLLGGSISNDANHISGPSRTGNELAMAIDKAIASSNLYSSDIDFISAHGTGTEYNDEMEAKALTLSALENVPANSLKGYYGHTLGAAGLLESIITMYSMNTSTLIASKGFEETGTTLPVNICKKHSSKKLTNCLKTSVGFGGCNSAIIINKQ